MNTMNKLIKLKFNEYNWYGKIIVAWNIKLYKGVMEQHTLPLVPIKAYRGQLWKDIPKKKKLMKQQLC